MPPQTAEEPVSISSDPASTEQDRILENVAPSLVISDEKKLATEKKKSGQNATWWVNGAFVVFVHVVSFLTLLFYRPDSTLVALLPILIWFPSGFGITAGYHRLWSHRAYSATLPLKILLMILGTSSFQGSIKWWVVRHRLHHRFTDTDDDPYTVRKGFFFAHMGWIFEKPHYQKMKLIDSSDLEADPVVRFQHKYYVPLALTIGFGLPALAGYLYGDVLSILLYAGFLPRLLIWHATFSINSVAHWFGEKEFAVDITARGNIICSLFTFGEGYHNFHHAFPRDYRNGIYWYDYDPTKWLILISYYLGFASDLAASDPNEIEKARLEVIQQHLDQKKKNLKWVLYLF
jgi:stearoyl-CoA desaturase (delta-9 desaturase)